MRERGLAADTAFVADVEPLELNALRERLNGYDVILRF
jgi:tRNA 2-thiouridine synthesizing protein C